MTDHMTYADMKSAIQAELKQTTGKKDTIIEYMINMVYLSEVLSSAAMHPFHWLLSQDLSIRTFAPLTITGISAANPGAITVDGDAPANGNIVSLYGISGMTELNGRQGVVAGSSGSSFNIGIDTSGFTAWSSGGKVYHRGKQLTSAAERLWSASWNGQSGPMEPMTHKQMEGDGDRGTAHHNLDNTGCPTHYLHQQAFTSTGVRTDSILWTPAPDAVYSLRLWYQIVASRLSNTTDVPLLPPRTHDVIVSGVLARMVEGGNQQVKAENATIWPTLYQASLAGLQKLNEDWWNNVENAQAVSHFLA
jgi:hypothetical protein